MCTSVNFDKPIEYNAYGMWRDAKLLDKDYNGQLLIKYFSLTDTRWYTVSLSTASGNLRNVPEKKIYRVVVSVNKNSGKVSTSKVEGNQRAFTVGETLPSSNNEHVVIGYHEGEYTL